MSSDPDIGDFVSQDPASTNLRKPLIGAGDKVVTDRRSGLFCPFNAGKTTVTVKAGGLAYTAEVTVQAGSVQRPCGTRPLNPERFRAGRARDGAGRRRRRRLRARERPAAAGSAAATAGGDRAEDAEATRAAPAAAAGRAAAAARSPCRRRREPARGSVPATPPPPGRSASRARSRPAAP